MSYFSSFNVVFHGKWKKSCAWDRMNDEVVNNLNSVTKHADGLKTGPGKNKEVKKEINAVTFKKHVVSSMKSLFGEVGISRNIDLLSYDCKEHKGILRCHADLYVKVRAALTLFETNDNFSFQVLNTSPLLISLVSNSRTYEHC